METADTRRQLLREGEGWQCPQLSGSRLVRSSGDGRLAVRW